MKKILFILNYYYPYTSGVSEVARLLAEELVKRGYLVTVLTSNHDKLPDSEIIQGVRVIRAPILCKISKGTISIEFITLAKKLAKSADVVNFHLPMLEAGILSCMIPKEKIYVLYQCDINLPIGIFNQIIVSIMDWSHQICLKRCRKILVTTLDYAQHSRILPRYSNKTVELYGTIKDYSGMEASFEKKGRKIIGFCGRIVEEKGILVLLKAFEKIYKEDQNVELLIGGDYLNIAGGSIYSQLIQYINTHKLEHIKFLGKIPEEKMGEFYSMLDVFVLPSINSLEAFGLVQLEAMLCGTPVVASDLYGVRTIVKNTGMGLTCKTGDVKSLAQCIQKVIYNREKYVKSKETIIDIYGMEHYIERYEKQLFS